MNLRPMSDRSTPFIETEALLAVMEEDREEARTLLRLMFPGELSTFADQVKKLRYLIEVVQAEQREDARDPAGA